MRHTTCIVVILLSLYSFTSKAQKICGTITEADGITPIEFAQIIEVNTRNGALTDVFGKFCIEPQSSNFIEISHIGYETILMEPSIGNKILIKLIRSETTFPTVVIQPNFILRDSFFSVGSGTSLNERQLKQMNYTDLNRIVGIVAGVNIQEEDGFGLRPNIGLRGSGANRSSKITLMEDGILVAPAPYSAAAAYYFPTMGRMQGIEILKGTAQIPYGPNTTGGAINLISAQFTDKLSTQFWMEKGTFGTSTIHTRFSNRYKNFVYLAEFFNYQSDGFKTLNNNFSTGFNKSDYLVKFGYNWGQRTKHNLAAKLSQTDELSNETYLGTTRQDFQKDPMARYAASQIDNFVGKQQHISLRYSLVTKKGLEVSVVAYQNKFHRNWYKLDKLVDSLGKAVGISAIVAPGGSTDLLNIVRGADSYENGLQVKANNRDYYAKGVQANFGYRLPNLKTKQYFHGGIRYHQDGLDRFQWTDAYNMKAGRMLLAKPGAPGTESNLLLDAKALSGFVQYDITIQKWQLNPGIRYENISIEEVNFGKTDPERKGLNEINKSNKNHVIIPGMGFKYNYNALMSVIGGLHRGFTPSSVDSGSLPELSINTELGFMLRLSDIDLKVIGFNTAYDNLLTTDAASTGGSGNIKTFNGGKAMAQGIEVESGFVLYSNPKRNLKIPAQLTYTYTNAKFLSDFASTFESWGNIKNGDEIPFVASHQGNLMLSLYTKYGMLTLNNKYTSAVRTLAGQNALNENNAIDAIFLTDLNIQFNMGAKTRLLFGINNVWNNSYVASTYPSGYRPGMPRYVHGGVRFTM